MDELQKLHRRKLLRKSKDIEARSKARGVPKGFNLAKRVNPVVFKRPLNVDDMALPAAHED